MKYVIVMSAHKRYLKHIASVCISLLFLYCECHLHMNCPISWNLHQLIRYQPVFGATGDLDSLVWIWVLCVLKLHGLTPHISVRGYQ